MTGNEIIVKMKLYLLEQFHLSEEQVEEMFPGFAAAIATHMQNLDLAIGKSDTVAIGKAAHTLKGALLNLGMDKCAKIALSIEERAKSDDKSSDFRTLADNLRSGLNPLIS